MKKRVSSVRECVGDSSAYIEGRLRSGNGEGSHGQLRYGTLALFRNDV